MDKNASAQIVSTAIRLQASRTLKRDVAGLDKTPEGQEFAKAIANGAAAGMTPQEVVGEVVKAMGGNQGMALDILTAVEELAKAHVEQHTRTLANGKTVNVKAYENARAASMKGTTLAHGATFHAMRAKSPEAHENAARMHEEAAKQHGEAHEVHPRDVAEVGKEHATLKGQHQMAVDYHTSEAKRLREEEGYNRDKAAADKATAATKQAYDAKGKMQAHRAAYEAHEKAAATKPGAGHEEQAEAHDMLSIAHGANFKAGMSKLDWKHAKRAGMASSEATDATEKAIKSGSREDHGKAAALHAAAMDHHMALHGEHESDEDGQHGQVFQHHHMLYRYHQKKAGAEKEAAAVAKSEGPMTCIPITTDLAEKKGGEALAQEGRPKEDEDEVAKAHVGSHTRTVKGKVVQVGPYDTAKRASASANKHEGRGHLHAYAAQMSRHAETISEAASDPAGHGEAAQAHDDAAEAHRSAGTHDIADIHIEAANAHRNATVAKAHVQPHTRTVGGKVVQVSGYENGKKMADDLHAGTTGGNAEKMRLKSAMSSSFRAHNRAHTDMPRAHEEAMYDHGAAGDQAKTPEFKAFHEGMAAFHKKEHDKLKDANSKKNDAPSDEDADLHEELATSGGMDMALFPPGADSNRLRQGLDRLVGFGMAKKSGTKYTAVAQEDIGKAQVEAHTRQQGGKIVQVSAYETHRDAAHSAMHDAYKASAHPGSLNAEGHTKAAAAHQKGAALHREAAKYAPDEWVKTGHEQQAKAHEVMAKGHANAAKAAGSKADTGIDAPLHTTEDIEKLENHPDYGGFGYLGHSGRDAGIDLALEHAANKARIPKHELHAHLLSTSGRHMMDDLPAEAQLEEGKALGKDALQKKHDLRVAHFHRWLTDPKKAKEYGIKDYAADLKANDPDTKNAEAEKKK